MQLDASGNRGSLAAQLQVDIERLRPAPLDMTEPGDWRVLQAIKAVADSCSKPLEIRENRNFLSSVNDFAAYALIRVQGHDEQPAQYLAVLPTQ